MTEAKLYQSFKRFFPEIHFTRIENSIGTGMFDINCCCRGQEFWIETKIDKTALSQRVLLRASQYAWGSMRQKQGGKIFVVSYKMSTKSLEIFKPPFTVVATKTPEVLLLTSEPVIVREYLPKFKAELLNFFISS